MRATVNLEQDKNDLMDRVRGRLDIFDYHFMGISSPS